MEFLEYVFPISGVRTNILIPPLVALVISFFTSMGGVSGAFLLLPFQVSVLTYTSPSVSGTNLIYNIIAIPGGVYRFIREGRMIWPLAWVLVTGLVPGVVIGYFMRVLYFPDPGTFRIFAGCVLFFVGAKLLREYASRNSASGGRTATGEKLTEAMENTGKLKGVLTVSDLPADITVRTITFSLKRTEYEFRGERYSYSTTGMLFLACVVGIIGGAYGIGGGAIMAPLCITIFRLPVYTVAGAALLGTFTSSVAGVSCYMALSGVAGATTMPDWLLGALFGLGGSVGIYCGARLQKHVPQRTIKLVLGVVIITLAMNYILL